MLRKTAKREIVEITPLSNFIRNASYAEKTKVYTNVIKKACDAQKRIIEQAAIK